MRLSLKMNILKTYERQTKFAQAIGMRDDRLSRIITGRIEPAEEERKLMVAKLGAEDEKSLFLNEPLRTQFTL